MQVSPFGKDRASDATFTRRPEDERIGQVDATDFCADVRGGIVYFDGLMGHVPSSLTGSIAVDRSVPVVRQESAALPDFDPTYDRYGSNSVIAAMSASLFPPKRKFILILLCRKRATSELMQCSKIY